MATNKVAHAPVDGHRPMRISAALTRLKRLLIIIKKEDMKFGGGWDCGARSWREVVVDGYDQYYIILYKCMQLPKNKRYYWS